MKELERQRTELEERLEHMEEETPRGGSSTAVISNSAFDALKVGIAQCMGGSKNFLFQVHVLHKGTLSFVCFNLTFEATG